MRPGLSGQHRDRDCHRRCAARPAQAQTEGRPGPAGEETEPPPPPRASEALAACQPE